jgi:hypothetical protein
MYVDFLLVGWGECSCWDHCYKNVFQHTVSVVHLRRTDVHHISFSLGRRLSVSVADVLQAKPGEEGRVGSISRCISLYLPATRRYSQGTSDRESRRLSSWRGGARGGLFSPMISLPRNVREMRVHHAIGVDSAGPGSDAQTLRDISA